MIEHFLTGAGAVAIVGGLSAWLGRVWANRILQKDRIKYETQMNTLLDELRTQSGKELFVHRLQFEKEFEVYLGLWKEVLRAGRASSAFRELRFESDKSRDEEIQDVVDTYNRLKDRVYDYRPFYAPEIYDLLKSLLAKIDAVRRNQRDARVAETQQEDTEKMLDEINNLVPKICDSIRTRIFA